MTALSPLLQHLVQTQFKVAQDQFREVKNVVPQATLLGEDDKGLAFVPIISMVDIFKKKVLPTTIKGVWGKMLADRPSLKLLAIVLMMDMWTERVSREEAKSMVEGRSAPPSQKPGSQEVILVQLTVPEGDRIFQWPYVRVGEEVIFAREPEENKGMGAVFPGLWPL